MGFLKGIGGFVGKAFEAIGLGKIAPFVSLGINALTGNWAAVAFDVAGLLSKIKGFDFLNKVAQFAPLGGFDGGGGFGANGFSGLRDLLRPERLREVTRNFRNVVNTFREFKASAQKVQDMFRVIQETADYRAVIQTGRDNARLNA
jgi:hypothetical protein